MSRCVLLEAGQEASFLGSAVLVLAGTLMFVGSHVERADWGSAPAGLRSAGTAGVAPPVGG